jgi:hypothetical protein
MLKKLIISSAITLLASTTQAIAVDSNTMPTSFAKDFVINVEKTPMVIVDPPVTESVAIDIDELISLTPPSGDPNGTPGTGSPAVTLGEMIIETTASSCEATITTENNFELKGIDTGATLAWYDIHYKAVEDGTYPYGTHSIFGANSATTQPVSCGAAMIDFAVLSVDNSVPEDNYDDVIRVVVVAES